MLIMELPVGAKKEKKEVALNNLSAIMDRWAAANIIITTTIKGTNFGTPQNARNGSFWLFLAILGAFSGPSGARIKILRPLFIRNIPPKTSI